MRTSILATAAYMTLVAGVAFAQTATTPPPADNAPAADTSALPVTKEIFKGVTGATAPADATPVTTVSEGQLLASGFIGKAVYNGDSVDAQSIGELNDLIIGPDGMVHAAVIGVGGFLGIGEKSVAIPANQLKLSVRSDKSSWIVVNTTKEDLQNAPAFEVSEKFTEGVADPMKANEVTPTPATKPSDPAAPAPAN